MTSFQQSRVKQLKAELGEVRAKLRELARKDFDYQNSKSKEKEVKQNDKS